MNQNPETGTSLSYGRESELPRMVLRMRSDEAVKTRFKLSGFIEEQEGSLEMK